MPVPENLMVEASPVMDVLVQLLKTYESQILVYVDAGESALGDALVALVSKSNPLLGAVLKASEAKLLATVDGLTKEVLDSLIVALGKNS